MAPKKKNAFIIFCEEYRYKSSKNGRNMSLKQATEVAGPLWSKMSEQEKEKYRQKAKQSMPAKKLTNLGIPIDRIEKEENDRKAYELDMFVKISHTVQNAAATHSLQYMDICIFHVNTFCYSVTNKRYYPAEIAVSKFNLRDGVWDVYHTFCHPGPFPLGYASAIQSKSDQTHQLLPQSVPNNMEKVFYDLVSFIDDNRSRNKPPPLYIPPNNYTEAKEVLSTMSKDCGYDALFLEAYSLTHLFHQMRNAAAGKTVFPSITVPIMEFERDVYEYASNIACTVHEELGVPNHCSKSVVTRMAYTICDHCCRDLNIELIPGRHVTFNSRVAGSRASSEISSDPDDYRRRRRSHSSSDLSDVSADTRFSSAASDDDLSSVASLASRMRRADIDYESDASTSTISSLASNMRRTSLQFHEIDAGVSSSSCDVKPLVFNSCSVDDGSERYFESARYSQGDTVSPMHSLSQQTVHDYASDDTLSSYRSVISQRTHGRGRGYYNRRN